MMKKVGLVLLALVVLFLVVGLFLPSKWHVEKAITIAAEPATITPFMTDTKSWEKWAAWNDKMDPDARWNYFVPADTKMSAMSWSGPKMGTGLLKIVEVVPGKAVRYQMQMEGTLSADGQSMEGGSPAAGGFNLSYSGGKTLVTWIDEGSIGRNIPARYFVGRIEKMLGEHFVTGLEGLKKVAEEAQAAADKVAAEKAAAEKAAAEAAAAQAPADGAPQAPAVTAETK